MKKLYTSILALMVLVALFSTVAYAWLAMATVNSLENLSLSAASDDYLKISLDDKKYSNYITQSDMLEQIKKLKFDSVTSNDGINFTKGYSYPVKAIKNVDYMSLTIYLKTTSQYREVHLSDNLSNIMSYNDPPSEGTYIISEGQMFKSEVTYLYDIDQYVLRDEVKKYYGSNAMRVSVVNHEDITKTKIFDLSENEHRGFGKSYGAIDYLNKVRLENNIAPEAPKTIYKLSEFEDEPFAKTFDSRLITLEPSNEMEGHQRVYKGSITLNVWLEGWDADAFDGINKDKLKMQFMFKAVMPAAFKTEGDTND